MGEGAVVAILDTGVSAGKDGYVNLLPGYDFVDDDRDPSDDDGHGSHVAATVAQASFNRKGAAGVAPEAAILPVRVLGPKGGTSTNIAEGSSTRSTRGRMSSI